MAKAKIQLLGSVKINGHHFEPEVARILPAARDTAPEFVDGVMWVTSANDSKHMPGSRHFSNQAFDLRIRNIKGPVSKRAAEWAQRLKAHLGSKYDVVHESDHLHVEFDPD